MPRLILPLAFLLAAPAIAADPPEEPPARIATLIVYGNDPCPRGTGDEIVVCARQPESERYRLPKRFRGRKAKASQEAWTNTVSQLEWVSRVGTPNSCSPVGTGGQTGCFQQFQRLAREERELLRREAAGVP